MQQRKASVLVTLLAIALLSFPLDLVEASHSNSRTDFLDVGSRTCNTHNPYNVVKAGTAQSFLLVGLQPAGHLTLNATLTNVAGGSGIGCTLYVKITSFTFTGPTPGGSLSKTEGDCFALDATCTASTTVHWSINFPGTVRLRITYDLIVATNIADNPRHSVANVDYGDPSVPGMDLPPLGVAVPLPLSEEDGTP